jgi:hypothetical protein
MQRRIERTSSEFNSDLKHSWINSCPSASFSSLDLDITTGCHEFAIFNKICQTIHNLDVAFCSALPSSELHLECSLPLHSTSALCVIVTETIFPRIYACTYYAHPRARIMSFSHCLSCNSPPILAKSNRNSFFKKEHLCIRVCHLQPSFHQRLTMINFRAQIIFVALTQHLQTDFMSHQESVCVTCVPLFVNLQNLHSVCNSLKSLYPK